MPDAAYWKERFLQLEESSHRKAEDLVDDIEDAYRKATRELDHEISTWYRRFADNNGVVSMAEAKRLLNSGELKEFKWTVNDYIKHGRENGVSADWSKELENASARWHISRLETLKIEMQNTIEVLYGNQLDKLDHHAKDVFVDTFGHTSYEIQKGIGVGWNVVGLNSRMIQTVANKPWNLDGRNFSDRIWTNKQALIGELHKGLTQNLLQGGNVDKLVEQIEKKMGVSHNAAKRLVYTENAYFHSVAQLESYKATGVKKVLFVATLDERTSDICRDMDGQVIDIKDYSPGTTVPPLHPYCRSVTTPYYDDMAGIGERAARDPDTGKTYFVPREMTYHEWEKTFMEDPDTGESGSKNGLQEILADTILNLNDCKTVKDVESYMDNKHYFREDKKVDLTDVDFECAKGIAEAYDEVMNAYPLLVGNIQPVFSDTLGPNTYAQCYFYSGRVEVNKKWFADFDKLKKGYESDKSLGFHTAGTDWKSIVTHEIGHALDGYLTGLGVTGKANLWTNKDVSAYLRPKVMRSCGLKVSDAGREVSQYATKNAHEWFAECFAEAMKSANPRKVATEFKKQLDELIAEAKKGGTIK